MVFIYLLIYLFLNLRFNPTVKEGQISVRLGLKVDSQGVSESEGGRLMKCGPKLAT